MLPQIIISPNRIVSDAALISADQVLPALVDHGRSTTATWIFFGAATLVRDLGATPLQKACPPGFLADVELKSDRQLTVASIPAFRG